MSDGVLNTIVDGVSQRVFFVEKRANGIFDSTEANGMPLMAISTQTHTYIKDRIFKILVDRTTRTQQMHHHNDIQKHFATKKRLRSKARDDTQTSFASTCDSTPEIDYANDVYSFCFTDPDDYRTPISGTGSIGKVDDLSGALDRLTLSYQPLETQRGTVYKSSDLKNVRMYSTSLYTLVQESPVFGGGTNRSFIYGNVEDIFTTYWSTLSQSKQLSKCLHYSFEGYNMCLFVDCEAYYTGIYKNMNHSKRYKMFIDRETVLLQRLSRFLIKLLGEPCNITVHDIQYYVSDASDKSKFSRHIVVYIRDTVFESVLDVGEVMRLFHSWVTTGLNERVLAESPYYFPSNDPVKLNHSYHDLAVDKSAKKLLDTWYSLKGRCTRDPDDISFDPDITLSAFHNTNEWIDPFCYVNGSSLRCVFSPKGNGKRPLVPCGKDGYPMKDYDVDVITFVDHDPRYIPGIILTNEGQHSLECFTHEDKMYARSSLKVIKMYNVSPSAVREWKDMVKYTLQKESCDSGSGTPSIRDSRNVWIHQYNNWTTSTSSLGPHTRWASKHGDKLLKLETKILSLYNRLKFRQLSSAVIKRNKVSRGKLLRSSSMTIDSAVSSSSGLTLSQTVSPNVLSRSVQSDSDSIFIVNVAYDVLDVSFVKSSIVSYLMNEPLRLSITDAIRNSVNISRVNMTHSHVTFLKAKQSLIKTFLGECICRLFSYRMYTNPNLCTGTIETFGDSPRVKYITLDRFCPHRLLVATDQDTMFTSQKDLVGLSCHKNHNPFFTLDLLRMTLTHTCFNRCEVDECLAIFTRASTQKDEDGDIDLSNGPTRSVFDISWCTNLLALHHMLCERLMITSPFPSIIVGDSDSTTIKSPHFDNLDADDHMDLDGCRSMPVPLYKENSQHTSSSNSFLRAMLKSYIVPKADLNAAINGTINYDAIDVDIDEF